MTDDALIQSLRMQARACENLASPFCAGFLTRAAEDVEAGGPAARLFEPWAGQAAAAHIREATALRFLGGFHEMALDGSAPDLALTYPQSGRAGDAPAAWALARELIGTRFERLADFMGHEPQTNEIGRSAALMIGFLHLAERHDLPLRVVELGASGGLNQIFDRLGYRFGAGLYGDPASPVQLTPEWRGEAVPPQSRPVVATRLACDRRPLDLSDPAVRLRLMAYVWPDQAERLSRLRAGVDMALAAGVKVSAMDAAEFVEAEGAPRPGVLTVIDHSVFWQYMPAATQDRARAAIEAHGAAAAPDAPFAWLRMEPSPTAGPIVMEIRLTTWPGGLERLLAHSHPHGTWIEYLG